MTTFAPDRPDWTREDTGSVIYGQQADIDPFTSAGFGLEGVASYTLFVTSFAANVPITLSLEFLPNIGTGLPIGAIEVSACENPNGPAELFFECPSYGGQLGIFNLDTVNTVLANVFSSNRVVIEPRYTTDTVPGRTLSNGDGFTAATPLFLADAPGGPGGYPANVNAGITVKASGAGVLQFWYRDGRGNLQTIDVCDAVGGPDQTVIVPLPQCIGQFYFVPSATDPAGTITAIVYPARS